MDLRAKYRTHKDKIVCKFGSIDSETMTATADRMSPVVKRLLPLSRAVVVSDVGMTAHFDAADLDAVLKIMKPRVRRKLSAEHRAKLLQAGAKFRFARKPQAAV
ncbi:MAG TPA: hypothetical protein VHY91_14400 [Pirellulales bacterium]|jgi:hypothetical protein|nr:hypothetical protein [Pirellulales bacterium]